MKDSWVKIPLFMFSLWLSGSVVAQEAENFYRYRDDHGNLVISNTLPAEAANNGYEIISPRGNVLERIAPRKTAQEIAQDAIEQEKKAQQEKQAEAKEQQALIQAQKDEILLKSFSSVKDIVRSRDEKISAIEVLENITKDNIKRLEKQLSEANKMVVTHQQQNIAIPRSLQNTIQDTQRQIKENQIFLNNKAIEKEQINKSYQDLIDRFNQLKNPQPSQGSQ